jgi:carbon monoxide dehydrogenase subunit G
VPETEYSAEIEASVEQVWSFVEVLENWAPYLVGFERLERVDERRSIWTLRGDVGVLSREVDLQADITLWEPLRRVEFTVTGLTERLDGNGSFLLEDLGAGGAPSEVGLEGAPGGLEAASAGRPVRKPSLFRRMRLAMARFVLRRLTRRRAGARSQQPPAPPSPPRAGTAGIAGARSRLTFKVQVSIGGPMAPMVELLMSPMLEPAAQDLADAIRRAVEA